MRYTVYMEHRVSWAVEVEADTPEQADALALDEAPDPTTSQEVDRAGDWETLSIVDSDGKEVRPS